MLQVPIPTNRPPAKPGEIIDKEFLQPLGLTQQAFADAMRVSRVRISEILNGRRAITPDTALRLERVLGPSAEYWLRLQLASDLYDARHSPESKEIAKLSPLVHGK